MKTELEKTGHSQWQHVFFLEKNGWMNKIHEIQIYAFQKNYNYPICASAVLKNICMLNLLTLYLNNSFSHVTFKCIQVILHLFEDE